MNDEEVKRLNKEGIELMGGTFIAVLKLMLIVPQFFITWFLRVSHSDLVSLGFAASGEG